MLVFGLCWLAKCMASALTRHDTEICVYVIVSQQQLEPEEKDFSDHQNLSCAPGVPTVSLSLRLLAQNGI